MHNIEFLDSIKKMPLMSLPVRTSIVTIGDKKIMISPGSALTVEQLKGVKGVTDLVAPNLFHTAGMPKAQKVFPDAMVWSSETPNTWPYQNELARIRINGAPKINEMVFVHKESKTLIVTDLFFNLLTAKGIGAWIILKMFGTYRQFGISKFWLKFVTDKEALIKSLNEVLTYDFDSIVVGHGDIVFGGGKEVFKKALQKRGLLPAK